MDVTPGGYKWDGLDFVEHDATEAPWPFEDKQFKVLTAFDFLEHLDAAGLAVCLPEMERVAASHLVSIAHWADDRGPDIHPTVQGPDWWRETLCDLTGRGWTFVKNYKRREGVDSSIFVSK